MDTKTRKQELEARRAEADAKHAKELERLEREERILALLPESVPLPKSTFTGSKLYGTQATLTYGDTFTGYNNNNRYSLADALALIDSISLEAVDLFTVKDSCLGIKPEHAITEGEAERAEIDGPFYGIKIVRELDSAKLKATVMLQGEQIEIGIALDTPHKFGNWELVSARTGSYYRGNYPEQDAKYTKQAAAIGQAKTVQYGGGSYTGRGSAGQMVYLFDCREALQGYADTLARKAKEAAA